MKNILYQNTKKPRIWTLTPILTLSLLKAVLNQTATQQANFWYERQTKVLTNGVSPKTICFIGGGSDAFIGKGASGLSLDLQELKPAKQTYSGAVPAKMDSSHCASIFSSMEGKTVVGGVMVSIVDKNSGTVTKYADAAVNQYVVAALQQESLFAAAQTIGPGLGNPKLYIINPANLASKVEIDMGFKAFDITYVNEMSASNKILVSMDVADEASFYLFDHTDTQPKIKVAHNKPKSQIVEQAILVPDPGFGPKRRVLFGTPTVYWAAAGPQDQVVDIWTAAGTPSKDHEQAVDVSVTHLCYLSQMQYMVAAGGKKFTIFKFADVDDQLETVTVANLANAITATASHKDGGVLALASELDDKIYLYNFLFAECDKDCKTCGFQKNDKDDCAICKGSDKVLEKKNPTDLTGECECDMKKKFKKEANWEGECECMDNFFKQTEQSTSCVYCDPAKNLQLKKTWKGDECTCKDRTYFINGKCEYCNAKDAYVARLTPPGEDLSAGYENMDYELYDKLNNNKEINEEGECVCVDQHYPVTPNLCKLCDDDKHFELINDGQDCKCKKGRFQSGDNCVKCHKACEACTGPLPTFWSCTECDSDVNYAFLSNNTCIKCKIDSDHLWCAENITTTLATKTMASSGGYIDLKMNVSLPNKLSWQARKKIDFSQLYVVSKVNQSSLAFQSQDGSQYNSSAIIPVVSNNDYLEYYYRIRLNDTFKLDDVKKLYIWPAYKLLTKDPGYQMVMTTLEVEVESHSTSSLSKFTEQKFYKVVATLAQIGMTALLVPALASALANGGVSSFLTFLIKYFQKIQIVKNLRKLNFENGENSEAYYANLDSISLPFEKLTHTYLKWNKFIHGDKAAKAVKGSNGKLTKDPDDVFMLSDVNWLTTFIVSTIWICSTLADLYAEKDDWLKVGSNFIAALSIDLTYYHLQLVSFSEISTSKFNKKTYREILTGQLTIPEVSIYFAIAFLTFISYDLIKTITLVIRTSAKRHKGLDVGQYHDMVEDLRYDKKLLLNKFTHGLAVNRKVSGSLLTIASTLRYLLIQMVISTLQEMERLQITLVLIIQVLYAGKLVRDLLKKGKTYDSKLNTWKHIIQETALTIVFFIFLIFAFRQTNEKFMQSGLHAFLETCSLVFLSVFILCEFIMIFYGGYNTTKHFMSRYKGEVRRPGAGMVRLKNNPPGSLPEIEEAEQSGIFVKGAYPVDKNNDSVAYALDGKNSTGFEITINSPKKEGPRMSFSKSAQKEAVFGLIEPARVIERTRSMQKKQSILRGSSKKLKFKKRGFGSSSFSSGINRSNKSSKTMVQIQGEKKSIVD